MGTLLLVVGLVWAGIGALNLVMLPWAEMEPGGAMGTIGIMFNMILFILPGLVVAGVGSALQKRKSRQHAVIAAEALTKKCPYCAETIKGDAVVCRYCGRDLPVSEEVAKRDHEFEKWLAEQQPPHRDLTPSERKTYRENFDYLFPP